MNKYYCIHDEWTNIDKVNDIEIQSTDGVISGITVNGEEQGGGSGDFSTAEITLNLTVDGKTLIATSLETAKINYPNENANYALTSNITADNKCSVLLYQGSATAEGLAALDSDENMHQTIIGTPVTSGGVHWDVEGFFEITGDGSITATLE